MKRASVILLALLFLCVPALAQDREITLPEKPNTVKYVDYSLKNTGYWFSVMPSAGYASCEDTISWVGQIDFLNGYRFSEYLKVGVGVSPRYYISKDVPQQFTVPVFAVVQGNMMSQYYSMFSPWWNVQAGYSIKEGPMASAGIGIKTGGIRSNFVMALNFTVQSRNYLDCPTMCIYSLKIGYEF